MNEKFYFYHFLRIFCASVFTSSRLFAPVVYVNGCRLNAPAVWSTLWSLRSPNERRH